MIRRLPKILTILLLTAVIVVSAQAERPWVKWSPDDGAPVRQGYHSEWYRGGEGRYAGELVGEVAFIWSDCRNGDRGVFLQVIGVNGNLKFAEDGLKIADANNRQENPSVWPSRDGGWYCVWDDFDADSLGDIYCTKIDAQGRRLWGNTERGLAVCQMSAIQIDERIVDDQRGGCIIAWHDERGGDPGDLYAQHILSDGRVDPNWPENGQVIVSAVGAQVSHTADEDGLGGMIIGWRDGRAVGNANIWAQRINPAGQLLWGDGDGIIVCGHAANQEAPKVCPDGSNGAFFAWVDDRNSQQTDKDIYVQRVSSNGQLMWPADGEPLCTQIEEQAEVRIVDSEAGFAILCWEDKRTDGLTYDVYAQRISGSARMRKEWDPPQGVPIVTARRNQQQARLFPNGQGGAYFAWEDERYSGYPEVDIFVHNFSRAGQALWQENGIPACDTTGYQNSPLIRRTADGGCVVAWGDYRSGSQEIWAQRFNFNGQIQWAEDGIPLVTGIGGNALSPIAIYHGDASYSVLWLDGRFGGYGTVPFVQTVRDVAGEFDTVFVKNGIPALTGTLGGGVSPDGCSDGNNGLIVVWEDRRVGSIYSIYAQHINARGERLWAAGGIKVAESIYEQTIPKVCPDGAGGAIIAWRAPSDEGDNNIYLQRIDQNGHRVGAWGDGGVVVANQPVDENIEQLISDGAGGAVLTWQVTREDAEQNLDDDLYITRVNSNGEVIWGGGEKRVAICNLDGKQRTSQITKHQNGYVVVWVDGRDDVGDGQPGNDIFGQFFDSNGTALWNPQGAGRASRICSADQHQDNPVVTVDNRGRIWVAWEDHRNAGIVLGADIYGQCLSYQMGDQNFVRLFRNDQEEDGRVFCGFNYNQTRPSILHDGQNGLWVAWEDSRSLTHSDIYATHLNPQGERYQLWVPGGNAVTTAFHKQEFARIVNLVPRGDRGAAIVWEDKRSTGKEELSNIFTQDLTATPLIVTNLEAPIPSSFKIEDVYPNPFNSRTFVTFTMPASGEIKIGLYDLSGRLALELGSHQLAQGTHKLTVNGETLASGQYFIRLETHGASIERPLHLVK